MNKRSGSAKGWLPDLAVVVFFAAFAAWLTSGLWPDPDTRVLDNPPADEILHEWFLAYGSGIWSGDFDLVTDRMNAPEGVNLMANTSVAALGFLLAPVTLTLGAAASFAVATAFNLAATASAWYLLFARGMRARRLAAFAGGAFCGFAPGMISKTLGHVSQTTHFLVPAMVWCVVELARAAGLSPVPRRRLTAAGSTLGLLVTIQVFLGEEVLFLAALSLAIFTFAYGALTRPARPQILAFGSGLGIAAIVAGCLLAYPLWVQFAGPNAAPDSLYSPHYFSADLASLPAFSPFSIAGSEASARLAVDAAERTTFFGWPLILLVIALAIWLRRNAVAQACSLTLVIMLALALGPEIVVNGHRTSLKGPYALIAGVPVVNLALPLRFALAGIPLIAILLVLGLKKSSDTGNSIVPVAVALALIPLIPHRLPTAERAPVPRFYSEGHWSDCASRGEVIVPVPLPGPGFQKTNRATITFQGDPVRLPETTNRRKSAGGVGTGSKSVGVDQSVGNAGGSDTGNHPGSPDPSGHITTESAEITHISDSSNPAVASSDSIGELV